MKMQDQMEELLGAQSAWKRMTINANTTVLATSDEMNTFRRTEQDEMP